jgi:hypothetical protein
MAAHLTSRRVQHSAHYSHAARRKLLRHKSEMSTATGHEIDLLMSLKAVNGTVMNSAY